MSAGNILIWTTVVPFLMLGATASRACSVSDIQIKQADIVRDSAGGQFSTVVGELVNGCEDAVGVQLHITLRDRSGRVISTSDPWPASIHNIPAHTAYAFTANADESRPAEKVQVDVAEVHKW